MNLPGALAKIPKALTAHGDTRIDDYYWLCDKQNPAVVARLEAENAYTSAIMAPTEALQQTLYDEILGHIKQTDLSVPYRRGGYAYYSQTLEGKQYPILCRREGSMAAPEEIVLDLNELAEGYTYLGLGDAVVSDDGNLLAYTIDTTGYRQYTLYVKNLRTGATLAERIERVDAVVWASDDRTLFYTTEDAVSKRADIAWRHVLGEAASQVVYEERDEIFDLGLGRTRDGTFVLLVSRAKDTKEWRYLPAGAPLSEPALFAARRDGVQYDLDARDSTFFIRTNEDAADYRLFTTPVAAIDRTHWTEIVAERPGTTIVGIDLFATFGVVSGRRDGLSSLELLDYGTYALAPLLFEEVDYTVRLGQNEEDDTTLLRFTYQSLLTPPSVYDLDVVTGSRTLLKRMEVPGFDPSLYESDRIFLRARDGTDIPVSIVSRSDVPQDGSAPLLLYAYGSYGISIDPTFSAARLSLLDRGVVYAIAHVRGGGELGEKWRLAGNLDRKMTTFTDFIDCAEAFVLKKYAAKNRIVIQGGSAGGLLVGAVCNMRPELFEAAIAQVPFVDVLTTMLDPSLPLTTAEYREWGDPSDAAAYAYMKQYSPVDNVKPQAYPAMLVEVAFNDSQVPYWEGMKLAEKIRLATTSAKPILLKAKMGAGHGGASGRYDAIREIAFDYAYALTHVGIEH